MNEHNIVLGLPHQYPFVLVDKILEVEYMEYSKGYKNVSYNEPWVNGHFPEKPIYPGVLLIETMAQVSGFMFIKDKKPEHLIYLCSVDKFKIRTPVVPGDKLVVEAELIEHFSNLYQINCIAKVDDKKVASGIFTLGESR